MLLPVFRDLIKPQWRTVLEALKHSGGQSAADLSRSIGAGYMTAKTHCEELMKSGYVIRTRLPRAEVGRPEILYSLSSKADALFPEAGVAFSLALLDEAKGMFGESGPEKLLFQYFQTKHDQWAKHLENLPGPAEKAVKLAKLREQDGCASQCEVNSGEPIRIVEFHNPLQRVFESYPRAAAMEQRMIEQLLGRRLTRTELPGGRDTPPRIVFKMA